MTEPRTECRKCGTSILGVTAGRFDGRCAPCWKKRPSKVIREVLRIGPQILFDVIAFPFVIVWECLVILGRRWRFPYPIGPLRKQVGVIYQNRRDTRIYLSGLIRGYFIPSASRGLPFDPRDIPHSEGLWDGTALKEGRVVVSDLPTLKYTRRPGKVPVER